MVFRAYRLRTGSRDSVEVEEHELPSIFSSCIGLLWIAGFFAAWFFGHERSGDAGESTDRHDERRQRLSRRYLTAGHARMEPRGTETSPAAAGARCAGVDARRSWAACCSGWL